MGETGFCEVPTKPTVPSQISYQPEWHCFINGYVVQLLQKDKEDKQKPKSPARGLPWGCCINLTQKSDEGNGSFRRTQPLHLSDRQDLMTPETSTVQHQIPQKVWELVRGRRIGRVSHPQASVNWWGSISNKREQKAEYFTLDSIYSEVARYSSESLHLHPPPTLRTNMYERASLFLGFRPDRFLLHK